jgi:uncharacterized protein (TIGR01777 family)
MLNVLITGGTGLIGRALSAKLLERGYGVVVLTRRDSNARRGATSDPTGTIQYAHWDPKAGTIDPSAVAQADYIVHLAGAGVAEKRWSSGRKKEIRESRTESSALLVKALGEIPNQVKAVIGASAIGWYGEDPAVPNPQPFEEAARADGDFLGVTCQEWETSVTAIRDKGYRLVLFRTGIVLSKEGGALAEFRKPVKLGLAAILGSGKQMISWVHIDDLCRLYIEAIERDDWLGIYNAVAPRPVDNRTLTLELAKRLKGRFFVPVYIPSFLLKMGLGEMSVEVLKSVTVSAEKLRRAGFQFIFPTIESALDELTGRSL